MIKTLTTVFIALCFFMSPAFAAPTDYDGKWNGNLSCTAYVEMKLPAFTTNIEFNVKNGQISANYSTKVRDRVSNFNWVGAVKNGSVNLTGNGSQEGAEPWVYELTGKATSNEIISFAGVMNHKGAKKRDCELTFTSKVPDANSLAAKSSRTAPAIAQIEPVRNFVCEAYHEA